MNEDASVFKPDDVTVTIAGKEYRLIYDLNAFCEMEKIYDSVDSVLQMLLGVSTNTDLTKVTFKGAPVNAEDITVADLPLTAYIGKINKTKEAKHTDTLNLLWLGCLHDYTLYDEHEEIKGYSISKAKLGAGVTFKNLREVNGKILTAILRDLVPSDSVKNAEAPEAAEAQLKLHKQMDGIGRFCTIQERSLFI